MRILREQELENLRGGSGSKPGEPPPSPASNGTLPPPPSCPSGGS
jgi:hypothetical protein